MADPYQTSIRNFGPSAPRMQAMPRSATDLLRDAATLIEHALNELDTTEEPACDHCGAKQFRNWSHARAFEKYRDMPMKLRESATRIEEFDSTMK